MKQGKLKQLCSLMIATVLLICCAMQYVAPAGEVQAETSDEPVYSADTGDLKYSKDTVKLAASEGNDTFQVTTQDTYFMSFTLKTAGGIYFADRGGTQRLYFATDQIAFLGLDTTQVSQADANGQWWISGDKGFQTGARVTIKSEKDNISLWIDGTKIAENLAITPADEGHPMVKWATVESTMTDVKIWTVKSGDEPGVVSEPVYDEATDMAYQILSVGEGSTYANGVLTVPTETNAQIKTDLPSQGTYNISFNIKGTNGGYVSIGMRGNERIQVQGNGYYWGYENTLTWVDSPAFAALFTETGAKVTICSTETDYTIWVGGVQAVSHTYNEVKIPAPNITWSGGEAILTDVIIWTNNTTDEPTYNDETDILYNVESISEKEVSYTDGIATVPDQTEATIDCGLAENAAYYMSMYVKVGTETTGTKYANIGTRNGGYIQLQAAGYETVGVVKAAWVKKTMSDLTGDGVRVTVYSSSKCMKVWVNGEKIVDDIYATFDKAAKPGITSNQGGVTLSHIKVWSPKAELEGASLTLDGKIGVNFFTQIDKNALSNTSVELTFPDKTVKTISTANAVFDSTEGAYKFTCDVAAKEMTEDVTIKFLDGEKVLDTCTYSVKAYADTILTNTEYAQYAPLVKAMLNYGATSQQYFDYNTDVLANKDLDPAEQVITPVEEGTLSVYAPVTQQDDTIGKIVGASLILESQTTLKIFFKLNADINPKECIVTYGQKQLNWVKSGDYQCVMIENINAADLDSNYSFTIKYHDDITFEVSYNPMTYCYNVIKQGTYSEKLNQLVYALCKYNTVANSYVVE